MTGLLDLPREIRDDIFSIILDESLERPLPTVDHVKRSNTRRDPNDSSARKVRYPSTAPPTSTISTLPLVNRQLYHESRDALEHHAKCGGSELVLDLLVGENKWLFPTWIQVLPYTPVLKKLRVKLRPFVDPINLDIGNPFVASWHFGDLINVILKNGPDWVGASHAGCHASQRPDVSRGLS